MPDFRRDLPATLQPYLEACDLILHAGDVTQAYVLDELREHAPVVAVLGNLDGADVAAWGALEEATPEVDGVRLAMIHDAGRAAGREERMRRRFPEARLVVFGHSHIPVIRHVEGVTFLNPGSPTWKRREPHPTVAIAHLAPGEVRVELVELQPDPRPGGR